MSKFNLDKLREIAEPRKLTRAEEMALEAYPRDEDRELNFRRTNYRIAYERGYKQAEKDTTERAIAWLKENANKYIVDLTPTYPDAPANIIVGGMCWEHLKDYLKMSKIAEEAALKAYPHYTAENITEVTNARHFFEKGYEAAEKDIALTWEDVKEIVRIADGMMYSADSLADIEKRLGIQPYYTEVLTRFKQFKEKNDGNNTVHP